MKAAAHNNPLPTDVFSQTIIDASIKTIDWRAPIIAYLRHYYEPDITVEQT
jgi:hypothetical protein